MFFSIRLTGIQPKYSQIKGKEFKQHVQCDYANSEKTEIKLI